MAPGALEADVEGDIDKAGRTIRITEIRVRYRVPVPEAERETVERALKLHPEACPAHESVKDSIRDRPPGSPNSTA